MHTLVVTGAAGALGLSLCQMMKQRGAAIAGVDTARGQERMTAAGLLALDASAGFAANLARVESELGPPTGAVLVAGGWSGGAPVHGEGDDGFAKMLATNLESAHEALRALLPGMVARKRGSIVVVGSRAVERPWESAGSAAYAASKAALVTLARVVAAETLAHGVRINAVLPSTIDTPANRAAMPDADPSRWVSPEGLCEVIAFLLSDAAREVTGAAIPVYGRV